MTEMGPLLSDVVSPRKGGKYDVIPDAIPAECVQCGETVMVGPKLMSMILTGQRGNFRMNCEVCMPPGGTGRPEIKIR